MSDSGNAVAVIVVHGVADQSRGETVQAVAEQLAGTTGAALERFDVPLAVAPCDAAVPFSRWEPGHSFWSKLRVAASKSLAQSFTSDFLDPRLGGADSERAAGISANKTPLANSAAADPRISAEPGVRFTDFLLAKAQSRRQEHGASSERQMNNVACFRVASASRPVEVFEMYWADLSRLSSSMPRMLTELFTLLFDLVRLGRNAVAMHGTLFPSEPPAMRRLGRLHHWADWLYTRLLAMLVLQLALAAILVALASLLAGHERGIAYLVCGAAGIAAAAFTVRQQATRQRPWTAGAAAGAAVAAVLALAVNRASGLVPSPLAGALLLLAIVPLGWAYVSLLGFWEERFRAVTGFGYLFGLVLLVCLLGGAISRGGWISIDGWIAGGLLALEVFLLLLVFPWIALAALSALIVAIGSYAGRAGADAAAAEARRRVISTGRLGLFASLGMFVVFALALWALFEVPLRDAVAAADYRSFWLDRGCASRAACFISRRFQGNIEMFGIVAIVLALLLGFLCIILLPCIALELGWGKPGEPSRSGAWLTAGYRAIERQLRWWSWVAAAVIMCAAVLLIASHLERLGLVLPESLLRLSAWLQSGSARLLELIVLAVAGSATGLLAIGRIGWKRVQALRTPLDAALDVDVHFREFPRNAIPRVRILERYVALLEHVLDRGYRRIVIVAHSQGSVITADLLRYLHKRHELFDASERATADRLVRLGRLLSHEAKVDLLTVGCPLRQLYATRFPSLYCWVTQPHGHGITGPKPEALGVRRWVNLWGAADYVGRWLWSEAEAAEPATLAVSEAAYDPSYKLKGQDWCDQCIGAKAHTHYFDLEERGVPAQLAILVANPP